MNRPTTALVACIAMLALLVPGAWAQDKVAVPAGNISSITSDIEATTDVARAAVTLDGEVLFRVRGVTAYPAERRALTVSGRIEAIAADRSVSTNTLHVVEAGDRSNLLAGDRPIMSVLDADAALEGVSRQVLAEATLKRIAPAIDTYRHDRNPRELLLHTGYALGATLVFALLLFGFRRAFRWLDALVERLLRSRIEGLQAQSHQIIQADLVWKSVRGLLQGLQGFLILVAVYLYLNLVLGLYPWTRAFAGRLLALLLDPLRDIGMGVLHAVPGLAFVAILAIVTRYVLRLTRLFFTSIENGTIAPRNFEREWSMPTYKIVRALIIVAALVMAYPHIPGSNSEAFKGLTIFLGVLFSLGSSSFIANLIAGYSVIYRRAFKVGDRIRVNEITGDVTEIRLVVTHLRTIKNEEITVPNSVIIASHVINYSRLAHSRGLILHTTVGIGYETSWRQVEAMLRLAAERTPGLLKEPPPFVLQKSLGDFAVTYELNVYCDNPQGMARFYTALHQNILDVFNEYGVQIMTPAYEGDPEAPKVVPKDQWFSAPAAGSTPPSGER
ncbi:mechanosensitive ion channel protein MscS [Candidatus Methylomirabilis limnetica]|uniref:Mechanosensitive ion channel protein MscS n=1 Tax=Candidatus Methylomirabilis limnetica TaxID=2033718 RepID=A0A2T4TXX2_9BACT|nr:mechanosensitive ion channel family protein [Candidatus Methylomirabilis limnetica]PTL35939.1 mechanosensitive ion channel protein MscS [Candidatus Methylomirabilis limnetica]